MTPKEKILAKIEAQGVSQEALAKKAGVSAHVVSNYLTERTKRPTWELICKLAKATGLPLEFLADDSLEDESEYESSAVSEEDMAILVAVRRMGYELAWKRLMLSGDFQGEPHPAVRDWPNVEPNGGRRG